MRRLYGVRRPVAAFVFSGNDA
ncbi:MAG: hypothetical protein V7641_2846, partial [Blastocatellia bacterium]